MEIKRLMQEVVASIDFADLIFSSSKVAIEKCVKEKVEGQFRSYSDFGKKLEDYLTEHLLFDVQKIKAPEFQLFIAQEINKQLALLASDETAEQLRKKINLDVLGEHRSTIAFDTFIREFKESIQEELEEDELEAFALELTQDDRDWGSTYYSLRVIRDTGGYSKQKEDVLTVGFTKEGRVYYSNNKSYYVSRTATWVKALEYRRTTITGIKSYSHSFHPYD